MNDSEHVVMLVVNVGMPHGFAGKVLANRWDRACAACAGATGITGATAAGAAASKSRRLAFETKH